MMNQKKRKSLYFILGITFFIIITISLIAQITFNYFNTKKQLESEVLNNIEVSSLQLKDSLIPYIEAYEVTEYEHLIKNEMYHKNLLAIVVEDFKTGKIIGEKSYFTGILRNKEFELITFDSSNSETINLLKNSFNVKKTSLINKNNQTIAVLSIYGTDYHINKELKNIITTNLLISLVIYAIVFFLLYISIKLIIIDPINEVISSLSYRKDNEMIFNQIDVHNTKEFSLLTQSINNMTKQIKQFHKELEENKLRWQFAVEGNGDGLWDWNIETNEVFFSKMWKEMLGFNENEIEDNFEGWESRVHPEDIEQAYKDIQKHLEGKTSLYINEHRMKCKNGTYKWILARGIIVEKDKDGNPSRVIGTHTDIDARKEYESHMKQALAVYENTNEGIMVTNSKNEIINVNPAFCETTGYILEEVIGENPSFLKSYIHSEEFYKNMWEKLQQNGYWQGEITNKKKNGSFYEEYLSINTIKDKDGNIENYIGIFSDITVVKEQEKMILQQARTSAIGEMIGNIAHQWRQPLSIISTTATGMKFHLEMGIPMEKSETIKTLDKINEQTQHLSKTIDDFRTFFTENLSEVSTFEISDTIKKVDELIKDAFTNNFVEIYYDIEENISINGNKNLLIQAFLNIYNNALDVLKDLKYDRAIFISAKKVDSKIVIKIKDNGGGVRKEYIDRIFDPYFTTKHQSQGTGIGLYMTHQIINKQFQGIISVKNSSFIYKDVDCVGAEFTIVI